MLQEIYQAPPAKIDLIPHGIPDIPFVDPNYYKDQFGVEGRWCCSPSACSRPTRASSTCSTRCRKSWPSFPNVVYIVLGATHPNLSCASRARPTGSASNGWPRRTRSRSNVIFYNRFVELEELKEFIGAADIYITPYLNEAQITSGTLAYTFGAARRWSRRPTGTRPNCWPRTAACWCRSATPRPSRGKSSACCATRRAGTRCARTPTSWAAK